jgi:hypothetical protein
MGVKLLLSCNCQSLRRSVGLVLRALSGVNTAAITDADNPVTATELSAPRQSSKLEPAAHRPGPDRRHSQQWRQPARQRPPAGLSKLELESSPAGPSTLTEVEAVGPAEIIGSSQEQAQSITGWHNNSHRSGENRPVAALPQHVRLGPSPDAPGSNPRFARLGYTPTGASAPAAPQLAATTQGRRDSDARPQGPLHSQRHSLCPPGPPSNAPTGSA